MCMSDNVVPRTMLAVTPITLCNLWGAGAVVNTPSLAMWVSPNFGGTPCSPVWIRPGGSIVRRRDHRSGKCYTGTARASTSLIEASPFHLPHRAAQNLPNTTNQPGAL